jgi:hypothetical protein
LFADLIGFEIYPEGDKMQRMDMQVGDSTPNHTVNFINCVRSREKPKADIEVGHKGFNACHLGNIAFKSGLKFKWDAEKDKILNAHEASKLMGRVARKLWDMI